MLSKTQLVAAVATCLLCSCGQTQSSCPGFQARVQATYGFRPSQLSPEEQRVHAAALDTFWNTIKASPHALLPCLRVSLEAPSDSGLFLVDGSNLLLSLDSSRAAKAIQVQAYSAARLDDIDLRVWVETLARRGVDGFDITTAGDRWLHYPDAHYYLPEHGAYEVRRLEGALYLYGSMPESVATPVLIRLLSSQQATVREDALYLLLNQATPEALRALRALSPSSLADTTRAELEAFLRKPPLFERRTGRPLTTRTEFLRVFHSLVEGDWDPFIELADSVPDGERDVVTVMQDEDLPLLREVRRHLIAAANQHGTEYYARFTRILLTLIWPSK